jgi:alanyl-tRNA synthetase
MMDSKLLRSTFIQFFEQKGHKAVSASPVVPQNDPTLLFTNAGMNQFKDVFLGSGSRPYTRAVNSQVCVRVSGKHNDLEDVGLDTTHLTSFEMLGNWSFGDYYKKEAILWAWELFTQVLNLPADKLYATVYKTDDESAALWKELTQINPAHVLPFAEKDNFWEMGETGPCGPCSELHLDRGPSACDKPDEPHVCEVNGVCNRYVELWNLVFIQYNRNADGSLTDLPHKHVDTGAGFERLLAYLQGSTSNYNTDLFKPIIQKIESLTGHSYQEGPAGMPHRVLADHTRTLVFAIADNVRPSNEGRGYVLRRLLRRALRYATHLGVNHPILHELVDPVVDVLGDHFTHLKTRKDFIKTWVLSEEKLFLNTLSTGLKLFDQVLEKKPSVISGDEAFKLYDTFGFPIDLTEVMAKERGLKVDRDGFEAQLEAQRNRSRMAQKNTSSETQSVETSESIPISDEVQALNDQLLAPNPPKTVAMGGEARLVTHPVDRVGMARHHTGTHLLHAALRDLLGEHVEQAGSLVDVHHLRFDYTHFEALKPELIQKLTERIEADIHKKWPVNTQEMPLEVAKNSGAMALFGEKYDDVVRVVSIGDFSKELCIGTHLPNTEHLEAFKLISESAIAAGTRRIEAIFGAENIQKYEDTKRLEWKQKIQQKLDQLGPDAAAWISAHAQWEMSPPQSWASLEASLLEVTKTKEKSRLAQLQQKATEMACQINTVSTTAKGSFWWVDLKESTTEFQRLVAEQMGHLHPDGIICVIGADQDTASIVVKKGPKATTQTGADQVLKEALTILGGRGGGKALHAQAGGGDPAQIDATFDHLKQWAML